MWEVLLTLCAALWGISCATNRGTATVSSPRTCPECEKRRIIDDDMRQEVITTLHSIDRKLSSKTAIGLTMVGIIVAGLTAASGWYYAAAQLQEIRREQTKNQYAALLALTDEIQINQHLMKVVLDRKEGYGEKGQFITATFLDGVYDQGTLTRFTDDHNLIGQTTSLYAALKEANHFIEMSHGLQVSSDLNGRRLSAAMIRCNQPVLAICAGNMALCDTVVASLIAREVKLKTELSAWDN